MPLVPRISAHEHLQIRVVAHENERGSYSIVKELCLRCPGIYQLVPNESGPLQHVEFWPKWPLPSGGTREPDVFLSFECFDLIVEAKRSDNYDLQEVDQLAEERLAYNVAGLEREDRDVYVLGVGGLASPTPDKVSKYEKQATEYLLINYGLEVDFKFLFIPWKNILIAAENHLARTSGALSNNRQIHRVLSDIRDALLLNQISFARYFSSLNNDVANLGSIAIDSIHFFSGIMTKTEWHESVSNIGHIDGYSMSYFAQEVAEHEWYEEILSQGQINISSLNYMMEAEDE